MIVYDFELCHGRASEMVRGEGWDGFLAILNGHATVVTGSNPRLYSVSTEWHTNPAAGINVLKARGQDGDVLVRLVPPSECKCLPGHAKLAPLDSRPPVRESIPLAPWSPV